MYLNLLFYTLCLFLELLFVLEMKLKLRRGDKKRGIHLLSRSGRRRSRRS